MEDSLSTVVGALAIGAAAVAKGASGLTREAYQVLRARVVQELGADTAVRALEDDPDSHGSQTTLVEALAAKEFGGDHELGALGSDVIRFATADASSDRNADASIRIGRIHGSVGAIVQRLRASGQITLGDVTADRGEARVSDLSAGTDIVARLRHATEEQTTPAGSPATASSVFSDFSAGRDIVLNLGSAATASKFSGKIQAFLEEYLVSETGAGKVPFGGRTRELIFLDRWLADTKAPARLVLVGPAGRGKSALLVHWAVQLTTSRQGVRSDDSWDVVFVPISIRFNTNRPAIFYEAIAARLAEILEVDLRPPQADPGVYFEDQCRMLARTAIERRRRILIVIDGIDEALGSSFAASWFPRRSEGAVRLLVSARLQIGDVDSRGWVRRLGWESGIRYQTLELPSLDAAGVKNLLATSGAPIDYLSTRPEIVDKLHRLSEGEPLVLRLYVEDLWLRGQGTQELTVEDLDRIRPGLSGYFEDWLRRQQDLWREDRKDGVLIDNAVLRVQLALLACAHGPLSANDMGELLRQCGCRDDGLRVEDGLYPLRRFVIGGGRRLDDEFSGYVLSHPRFGQFLREDYLDPSQVMETRAELARWGVGVVRRVNDGTLAAGQVPRYVLNYHCQHLLDADVAPESFMEMVEPGWLRACEAHEGGYRGFSEAVSAAMNAVLRAKPRPRNWRSALVRCALFQSSVASVVSQMPEEVLLPSVQAGLMSVRQVLHWLEFHPQDVRTRALVQLATVIDDANVTAALEACRSITDDLLRARSLSALIPRLGKGERHSIATEALANLCRLHNRWDRPLRQPANGEVIAEALASIVKYLDATELTGAASVASALGYDQHRVLAFLAIALAVPADERQGYLRQALSALSGVWNDADRRDLMGQLVPHLTMEFLYPLIDVICDGDSDESQQKPRMAEFVDELVSQWTVPWRIVAFEAAVRLDGRRARYKIGARILRHVPEDQRSLPLLTSIGLTSNAVDRSRFWAIMAEFVTVSVIDVFVQHAKLIGGEQAAAAAISCMTPRLSHETLSRTLLLALNFEEEGPQMAALFALAPLLSSSDAVKVISTLSHLGHTRDRGKLLISIIPRLPSDWIHAAAEGVARLTDPCQRLDGLLAVGCRQTGVERVALMRAALAIVPEVGNTHERAESIIACAIATGECEPIHRVRLLLECLRTANSTTHDEYFIKLFGVIAEQLAAAFAAAPIDSEIHLQLTEMESELHRGLQMLFQLTGREADVDRSLQRLSFRSPSESALAALATLEDAACWIPVSMLTELLSVAAAIADKATWPGYLLERHAKVLAAALPRLREWERGVHLEPILLQLEAEARTDFYGASVYTILATHVPKHALGEWFKVASTIENSSARARALVELAAQLAVSDRAEWLTQSLLALRSAALQRSQNVTTTLERVLPLLPTARPLTEQLLSIALEIAIFCANECLWDCIRKAPEHQRAGVLASTIEKAPLESVVSAVNTGGRHVRHAFASAAERVRSDDKRMAVLAALAQRLGDSEKGTGTNAAAHAALAIRDDAHRARILAKLAKDLPAGEALDALKEALRSSRTIGDETVQFHVLGELICQLRDAGSELASRAVSRLASVRDIRARCLLLHAISGILDNPQWLALVRNEVADVTSASTDWERSVGWKAVAPLLSEEQLTEAWNSATRIEGVDLLEAVASLVHRIPDSLVEESLGSLRQYPSEIRGELAIILASRVPVERIPEFAEMLADLGDDAVRARALLATGLRMTGPRQQEALRQAMTMAREVGDSVTFAWSLIALIEGGGTNDVAVVRLALEAVLSIPPGHRQEKMEVLRALVPYLSPEMASIALHETGDPALAAVLRPKLSDAMLDELLAGLPPDAIASLGAVVPAALRTKAFKTLQEDEGIRLGWGEARRTPVVATLLPYLDGANKDEAFVTIAENAVKVDREVVLEILPAYASMVLKSEGMEGLARVGRAVLDVGECFS